MATFTIDLLTGNLYLFSGNFSGSGSTPTSGSTYPAVNLYSNLPAPGTVAGQIYLVRTASGTFVVGRKDGGLYFSNGSTWTALPTVPSYFSSGNFQVYDSIVNTKGLSFVTSGITSGFKKLTIQNSDGTIAYLTDLNTKVDVSLFNSYTGATQTILNGKQNILIAGTGIMISGNTISVTGGTSSANITLQLVDTSGNTEINTISPTPIVWTLQEFSGTTFAFSGGSKIYITQNGIYGVGYTLNVVNQDTTTKNVGAVIRKNGNVDITTTTSASFAMFPDYGATNGLSIYKVNLLAGDYIELTAYRIGDAGSVLTVPSGSWITLIKY